jgi:hypothetical protein
MTTVILVILFAHFFGDFVIQPHRIAVNKWHDNKALWMHVLLYTLALFLFSWAFLIPYDGAAFLCYLGWAIVNGLVHFVIDYSISKDRQEYWVERNFQMYFIFFGVDQMLHYAILAVTYPILILILNVC